MTDDKLERTADLNDDADSDVRVVSLDIPFEDIFWTVFKVIAASILSMVMIGLIVLFCAVILSAIFGVAIGVSS